MAAAEAMTSFSGGLVIVIAVPESLHQPLESLITTTFNDLSMTDSILQLFSLRQGVSTSWMTQQYPVIGVNVRLMTGACLMVHKAVTGRATGLCAIPSCESLFRMVLSTVFFITSRVGLAACSGRVAKGWL